MVKWERNGTCTFCGYCCRFPFQPTPLFFPKGNAKLDQLLKIRGFVPASSDGTSGNMCYSLSYQKCPHHVDEKCDLYGKPERPQMCVDFPETPSQVRNTPCSYWFEDESGEQAPIGGEGSPYPSGSLGMSDSPTSINVLAPSPEQEGMV